VVTACKNLVLTHTLQDAAALALKAVDAKDKGALLHAIDGIDKACENCHLHYWYPNDKRARQAAKEDGVIVGARFDLVRPNENGYVFPAGDVEALAAVLRQFLPDLEKRARMGAAARQRMETWSPREYVESMVRAVHAVAKDAAAP
jgi:hypothetical protein